MILAVDAGNTRIKWGVHDGDWRAQGSVPHEALHSLAEVWREAGVSRAVVSSVAGDAVNAGLQSLFDDVGVDARWIKAQAAACGVRNGYSNPAQLGSDRWAALVAAWHRTHAACVVVSAGTALTVDALSSHGDFLGGLIVPGLVAMKRALVVNTARVLSPDGDFQVFPTSTGNAVHSGALRAMTGAVEQMYAELARIEHASPRLILAGGDAGVLQAALSAAGEIVDNLVLEGLILIAGESA